MHELRTSVFSHLRRQSIAFFTRTRTGEVQSRIQNDIGGMESVLTSTATSIASNLTTAVATAAAMVALSWRLSLISLAVMPPAIFLSRKVARMRRAITSEQQRELADLNVTIEEGLPVNGVQLAKTMGAGPALIRRFAGSSARLIDLELRSQLAGRWRMASLSIIFAAIPAVIYLAAGLPVTAGAVSIGTLIAFTTLQNTLFRPITGLLNTGVSVISSLALFARIFEYLDLPVEVDEPARHPGPRPHHHHHRAPAVHRPPRRPDHRARPRPHRRGREPRQPAGRPGPLCRTGRIKPGLPARTPIGDRHRHQTLNRLRQAASVS
jgi:ATP-binding cassette subfamily B protein